MSFSSVSQHSADFCPCDAGCGFPLAGGCPCVFGAGCGCPLIGEVPRPCCAGRACAGGGTPFFEYCTREPDVTVAAPLSTGCGVVSASGITGVNLISLMVIVGFRGLVSLETVDLICSAAAKVVVCRMLHASP